MLRQICVIAMAACGGVQNPGVDGAEPHGGRFSSGFDDGVGLGGPELSASGGNWKEVLSGTDSETGFTWPADLPGGMANSAFWYVVSGDEDIASIVATRIEQVTGPNGEPTRALYQEVTRENHSLDRRARNMFLLKNSPANDLQQGTVRYSLKLQPNLKEILPAGGWRQIIEWREQGDQYRMAVLVRSNGTTGKLEWRIHGDFASSSPVGPDWTNDWTIDNAEIPVPIGEWFVFEAHWEQGTAGRLRIDVNCQTLADHVGRTMNEGPIDAIHVFKVYTGEESLALGPAYQWIDDVEFEPDSLPNGCP